MKSFAEAMAMIRAFDSAHWSHAGGFPTIRHTRRHLDISLTKIMASICEARTETEVRRHQRAITGLLLEHALRLARTLEVNFPAAVLDSDESLNENRWLSWVQANWPKEDESVSRRERLLRSELTLRSELLPWAEWIEQREHEESPSMEGSAGFVPQIQVLLEHAVWLGPKNGYDGMGEFLAPLEIRLKDLSTRFGYVPQEQVK